MLLEILLLDEEGIGMRRLRTCKKIYISVLNKLKQGIVVEIEEKRNEGNLLNIRETKKGKRNGH
tara:strand:+ start:89 stop:280 length:192 start_codon:yes stop_codon:yes gene_type:complete